MSSSTVTLNYHLSIKTITKLVFKSLITLTKSNLDMHNKTIFGLNMLQAISKYIEHISSRNMHEYIPTYIT